MKNIRKHLPKILGILVSMGVGAVAGVMGMRATKDMSSGEILTMAALLLPAFLLVIAVHEAGHAIAGVLVKFDFRMYVVGPFMWDKLPSGWTFKLNKNVNLFGGLVLCMPPDSYNLARRFSLFALGGPMASLALTGLALGVRWVFGISGIAGTALGLIGYLSLFIFLITIIPMHTGGFYTDGARALRFLRGGDTARFELLLLKAVSSSSAGLRPRDYNKADLDEALVLGNKMEAPMKVYLHFYLYQHALDHGDMDAAEKHLQDYLAETESIPKGMRGMTDMEAAFFYAYGRKDLEKAEQHWKKFVPSTMIPKAQVLATEAAIGKLKNAPDADQKIGQALQEIPNMIDRGGGIALRERMQELRHLAASEIMS